MLTVASSLASGSGTLPKNIGLNSIISLDASPNGAEAYEWELLSVPQNSGAILRSPTSSLTRFGPLDIVGVYQVRLWTNRNTPGQKSRTLAFGVPGTVSPIPEPVPPTFEAGGGRVRNWSFELPGPLAGWAAYWTVTDDADVLADYGGINRGRCEPTNFKVTSGKYAMVLGDDIGNDANISAGQEFSVSQMIDFTGMNILKLQLKFIDRE